MSEKEDKVYLRHMLDAAEQIQKYTRGFSYPRFCRQRVIQDAVIRQFAVIGEAAKRVSLRTRGELPGVPWHDITGMRDKLVHDYFGIDLEAVWRTVREDVPSLKRELKRFLK